MDAPRPSRRARRGPRAPARRSPRPRGCGAGPSARSRRTRRRARSRPASSRTREKRPGRSSGMRTVSMTAPSPRRKANFTKGSSALGAALDELERGDRAERPHGVERRAADGRGRARREGARAVNERDDPPRVDDVDVARARELAGSTAWRAIDEGCVARASVESEREPRGLVTASLRRSPLFGSVAPRMAVTKESGIRRSARRSVAVVAARSRWRRCSPRRRRRLARGRLRLRRSLVGDGRDRRRDRPGLRGRLQEPRAPLARRASASSPSASWARVSLHARAAHLLRAAPRQRHRRGPPAPLRRLLKDRIALGVGFFTPFDLVVRGRILYPERPAVPSCPIAPNRSRCRRASASTRPRVPRRRRIRGARRALRHRRSSPPTPRAASAPPLDDTLVASYGPIVGASYDFGDEYRVGATFRGKLEGRFNVVINVKDLGIHHRPAAQHLGRRAVRSMADRLRGRAREGPWHAALGATYKHWSAYPGAGRGDRALPRDRCGVPSSAACTALAPPPPNFHDTVSVRARRRARRSSRRRACVMFLRGGVFFEPIAGARADARVEPLRQHARAPSRSATASRLCPPLPPIQFDLFGQAQLLVPRTNRKGQGHRPHEPGLAERRRPAARSGPSARPWE